jgi:t-SNARE complex subunit (syntaxin)
MRLETSIKEVHQLFMDMALMVDAQGVLLDNIEEMVSSSAEYTESGVKELVKAKNYQNEARKKMMCIIVCFVICLLMAISYVSFMIPGMRRRSWRSADAEWQRPDFDVVVEPMATWPGAGTDVL